MAEIDYNCSAECLTAQNITSLPACWSTARKRVLDAIVALRNQICNFPCTRTVPPGTLPADFVDEGFGGALPDDCACPILTIIEGCNVWMGVNDAGCNLGDGTDWFAVGLSPSGVWGAGELSFACDDTSGTEIYVDSDGKLRGEPPIFTSILSSDNEIGVADTTYALGTTVIAESLSDILYNNPSLCRDAYVHITGGANLGIGVEPADQVGTIARIEHQIQIDGSGYVTVFAVYYENDGNFEWNTNIYLDQGHLGFVHLLAAGASVTLDMRGVAVVLAGGPVHGRYDKGHIVTIGFNVAS